MLPIKLICFTEGSLFNQVDKGYGVLKRPSSEMVMPSKNWPKDKNPIEDRILGPKKIAMLKNKTEKARHVRDRD